nr:hypothetical protein BaRGS_031243 [Batillaria attramentaria]KAG5697713.1 hypothetical protein BaRGS_000598 [Batillaria attramentaria]
MDAENEHFRFYTFMRLKLGDNGKKILQDLQAVFGAKCVAPNRWNLKDLNAVHDNAAPLKAKITTTFLEEREIKVLAHPPYSPDLAPCDFWLFPILKERLAGRKFDRIQDLSKAVKSELEGMASVYPADPAAAH